MVCPVPVAVRPYQPLVLADQSTQVGGDLLDGQPGRLGPAPSHPPLGEPVPALGEPAWGEQRDEEQPQDGIGRHGHDHHLGHATQAPFADAGVETVASNVRLSQAAGERFLLPDPPATCQHSWGTERRGITGREDGVDARRPDRISCDTTASAPAGLCTLNWRTAALPAPIGTTRPARPRGTCASTRAASADSRHGAGGYLPNAQTAVALSRRCAGPRSACRPAPANHHPR